MHIFSEIFKIVKFLFVFVIVVWRKLTTSNLMHCEDLYCVTDIDN